MKRVLILLTLVVVITGLLLAGGCYQQPACLKASGERVHLVNSKSATDPTWNALQGFLLLDDTDDMEYGPDFQCGDFAETLHNKAESVGIKAAFVVVEFSVGEPHALNMFSTTDRGLVYIDCAGPVKEGYIPSTYIKLPEIKEITFELPPIPVLPESSGESPGESLPSFTGEVPDFIEEAEFPNAEAEYDKVAYVSKGMELGFVSVGIAKGTNYSYYEEYKQMRGDYDVFVDAQIKEAEEYNSRAKDFYPRLISYNVRVEDYNRRVNIYDEKVYAYNRGNDFYNGKRLNYYELAMEYDQLNAELAQLEREAVPLDEEFERLGREREQVNEEADKLMETLEELGYFEWEPTGIVSDVEIWW